MVKDLLSCRERAIEKRNCQKNRKQGPGYMEIMRILWEEMGYKYLGLTAQNLRDKAAQMIKARQENGSIVSNRTEVNETTTKRCSRENST